MEKTTCLIVDDEPLAVEALATLIGKIPELMITGKCNDAVEALQLIRSGKPDLVFLDIEMPELTGFDLLHSLANPPKVIFTTAYREFAVEAFELDVIDYLVKPVSFERLVKSINRYFDRQSLQRSSGSNERYKQAHPQANIITVYSDKKTHKIDVADVIFVEGLKDYAIVHTSGGRLIARQTMKSFLELLSPYGFLRVHRSWIVPWARISSWTNYSVNVGEKEIPIGKTYRKSILEYLENKSR